MQTYDILMLSVLGVAMIFGAWKGFAWQVASLTAVVASYFVALKFHQPVAEHIPRATPPWNTALAMLLLYVGTSFVIWVLFRMVSRFIDRVKLKEFDRQIGALFGLGKGVILCVIITLFGVALLGESARNTIVHSRSGHCIAILLDKAHSVLPDEIHDVIHPYIHGPLDAARQESTGAGENRPTADAERAPEFDTSSLDEAMSSVEELLQALEKGTPLPDRR